jgi:BirA family biotin operon repressor/biotin-[acetyl-CoA-carboxylase] ligase
VGRESDLNDVFQLVVGAIEARYLQLRSGGHAVIERDYLGRLYRLDVPQEFEADGAVFTGTIIGVDDSGRIRIQVGEEERRYSLKEVKFRFEDSGG